MNKNLLFCLLFLAMPFFINAQNGGSALMINNSPVTVADNTNGSLDVQEEHTIELWFKADEVQSDQKLFSKITGELKNGYILGIENATVKYEIFDDAGNKKDLIAGSLQAGQWTHLAASYKKGGKLKLYLNGVLVGETNDDNSEISYNTGPLTIGTNSWGAMLLSYSGELDEVRYWQAELTETTINNWMLRRVTSDHPSETALRLYHNYNTGSGQSVADNSTESNTGSFTTGSWTASTIPFKDWQFFAEYGPPVAGIWLGQETTNASDLLTLSGVGLTGDQSAIVESTIQTTVGSLCASPMPTEIDDVPCLIWHVVQQGNPSLSFSFDLSDYDLSNIESVVLLESTIYDFSAATILQGNLNGNTFEVPNHTISSERFYLLGFTNITVATNELEKNIDFTLSPNPSNGQFQLNIESEDSNEFQVEILDYSGKLVLRKQLNGIASNHLEQFDLSYLPAGLYILQLSSKEGRSVRKLIIE